MPKVKPTAEERAWLSKITLAEKQWGPETRVTFAGTLSIPFVNMMILGGCRQVLFSYWYLKEAERKGDILRVFNGLYKRAHMHTLMIDSGVFTFFKKMKMPGVNGKVFENPPEVMRQLRAAGDKKFDEFLAFTKQYVKFLNKYDKYISLAFDMDIDMFASVESADRLYEYIMTHYKSPHKVMRVWHHSRPFDTWKEWCDAGVHKYLSVEGAGTHGRDPDYYRRFTDYAHKRGVKVHVLATTSFEFLQHVPCDSVDSSTWSVGGRFGSVYSPLGILNFGRMTEQNPRWWGRMSAGDKLRFRDWLKEGGLEAITPEILQSESTLGVAARNIVNIYWFRRMGNQPVDAYSNAVRRVTLMDKLQERMTNGSRARSRR